MNTQGGRSYNRSNPKDRAKGSGAGQVRSTNDVSMADDNDSDDDYD
jgi:hypothetical protein